MRAPRVHVHTLGCAKNAVDSDKALARLLQSGWDESGDAGEADLVLVNTCAFIDAARRESVEALLDARDQARPGARVVAIGCLAQRCGDELRDALPDLEVVGFADYPSLLEQLGDLAGPRTSLQFFD